MQRRILYLAFNVTLYISSDYYDWLIRTMKDLKTHGGIILSYYISTTLNVLNNYYHWLITDVRDSKMVGYSVTLPILQYPQYIRWLSPLINHKYERYTNAWKVIVVSLLRPKENDRHFPDDIFKCIFLYENVWIYESSFCVDYLLRYYLMMQHQPVVKRVNGVHELAHRPYQLLSAPYHCCLYKHRQQDERQPKQSSWPVPICT